MFLLEIENLPREAINVRKNTQAYTVMFLDKNSKALT